MIINLFIFPIILFLSFFIGNRNTDNNRKWFIVLVSLILLLVNSLRSLSVGPDTPSYYWRFTQIQETPWQIVLGNFLYRYVTLSGDFDEGYNLFQKIISFFTNDFHVFTFIAQLLFFVPFGLLLYRYCKDFFQLTFAFILYVVLFNSLALSNARQVYAMGMGICSFLYLSDGKIIKSFIYVIIGFFFHQSCLLCLIPILMFFLPQSMIRIAIVIAFFAVPIILADVNMIIRFMGSLLEHERYTSYGEGEAQGGAVVYISMSLLMAFITFLTISVESIHNSKRFKCLYNMILPTVFFCPFIYSNGSMIRITIYFQLYFCILFAYTMDYLGGKNRRALYYSIAILLLMIMSLVSASPYYFFWQESQELLMITR